MPIKKIAVLTAGGDAPGMNAAIRAVVRFAISRNIEVVGVSKGYWGLINNDIKAFDRRSVSGIISEGGTILKTIRCPEFQTEEGRAKAFETIKKNSIDGMIVIGGNGSFTGANIFCKKYNVLCMGIAASIDNDINGIDATIGSDTAINTALYAIDNIRDTATSMERIFVVEVMGRDSGFIALQAALTGGCEDVIIPERKFNLDEICQNIVEGNKQGRISWIIVVAEGVGSAVDIAKKINEVTKLETRAIVLGHLQRGGRPTAFSRELALTLGHAAVEALLNGESGKAVGLRMGKIILIDFESAIQKKVIDTNGLYSLIRILT